LDGLESASAERVCVMITAMSREQPAGSDASLGAHRALARDGGAGHDARAAILREKLSTLPATDRRCGILREAGGGAARGLTGADLKSRVEGWQASVCSR